MVAILVIAPAAAAQSGGELLELRERLVDATGAEYVAARDRALALPADAREDLLFLLRLSPDYSLEQILAIILEARSNHPDEAARFDRDFQNMLDNPDMSGRHGRPIYRIWRSREPKEMHPLVCEAHLKIGVPPMVGGGLYSMTFSPNSGNIPFILYRAKHQSPGALSSLVTATKEHPEEREWLRPLALQMYKENRQLRNVRGSTGIIAMFRGFGTEEDLEILRHLREYESQLFPVQGLDPPPPGWPDSRESRIAVYKPLYDVRKEYRANQIALASAERENASDAEIQQHRQRIAEIESELLELRKQFEAKQLWNRLEESIERLEAQLQQAQDDAAFAAEP